MQQSELRMLVSDCIRLWGVTARLTAEANGIAVDGAGGRFVLRPAVSDLRPVRWLLLLPDQRERALPSITAALTTLRNALINPRGDADAAQ